jgi:arginine decarboxylase
MMPSLGGSPVLSGPPAPSPVDQERAPYFEALVAYHERGTTPLHTPGHKGVVAAPGLEEFLTPLGLACDLPSMDGVDYLSHPRDAIAEAQRLAADLWGARETFYLVHGSTIGVQAMIMAAVGPGDTLLLSRDMHLSAFNALVLSGARPAYLPTRWLDSAGPIPPAAAEIEEHLDRHPEARALFLTSPSYYGVGRPLDEVAQVCRRRGVALLVDEAHGAHLRFLPDGWLPSSLAAGADLVVHSVHKTVGSLVGTAQLHVGGTAIAPERVQSMLNILQTTSPNSLLLASLDLTRRAMARDGSARFAAATERAVSLRRRLGSIGGIAPLDHVEGCLIDPLRLVVDVSALGMTGFEVERRLNEDFGILDEFCDGSNVAFVLGPPDPLDIADRLVNAFEAMAPHPPSGHLLPGEKALAESPLPAMRGEGGRRPGQGPSPVSQFAPPVIRTPRDAAFAPTQRVSLSESRGRIAGEMISVYPPGIPLICPGELITDEVADRCAELAAQGACVFAHDPTLQTIVVL